MEDLGITDEGEVIWDRGDGEDVLMRFSSALVEFPNRDIDGGGSGVTDHGALDGLADDDHTQYHNDDRANTWLATKDTDDIDEGATNLYYDPDHTHVEADITDLGSYITELSEDATPELAGALDAAGFGIVNLGAVREDVTTVAATGSTETFALGSGDYTMDEDCTFSFPGSLTSGDLHTVWAVIRGAFTPTLPASIDWSGDAPSYASPSLYVFFTVDGGTTWLGMGRVGFA